MRRRGYSRLVPSRSADSIDPNVVRVDVPITTLDAVIGERKVDFIKLDVEGGELDALRGAPRTLSRRPVVLFEAGMHAERDWQADMSGLHALLSDAGYAISTVTDHLHARDPLNLEQFLATHEWPYRAWNFIARPL